MKRIFTVQAQPLKELEKPLLFLVGDSDKLCPLEDLSWEIKHLPSPDIRVEVFEVGPSIMAMPPPPPPNSHPRQHTESVLRHACWIQNVI